MSEFLLAVDVGNSRTKFGLFGCQSERAANELSHCLNSTAVLNDNSIPWEEMQSWITGQNAELVHGIIAGTNPLGLQTVLDAWPSDSWSAPVVVHNSADLPLQVDLDTPEKVGIDRLLNAVAANVVRGPGHAAIIVDSGTATTVDVVSPEGLFLGGAILPGFELSARSLHEYTALLPRVSIEELASSSRNPLGRSTLDAIHSGLFWGHVGAVKELIAHLTTQADLNTPKVLLTGGGAALLHDEFPEAIWEPHLALQGLAIAAGEPDR